MTSTPIAADPLARQLAAIERLISERKLNEAGHQLKAISAVARGDARVYLLISRLAEATGDMAGSIEGARLAVNAAPAWSVAMTEFALALARANQFRDSLGAAERALQMDPNNPAILIRVIDVAHRAQHFEVALGWLRRLWALAPDNRAVEQLIARDLRLLKRYPEALQAYNALIEADGPKAANLFGRLQTALDAGDTQLAQQDAAALLALEPENAEFKFWAARARGETPDQQPAEMVQSMYDGFAGVFDQHLVGGLKYRLPKLVAERILQWHPDRKFNLLDLGCGTGLLGVCLGRIDGALIGVDVSQAMIDLAARHNVYDRFHRVDLLEALAATPESLYEVLAALDVFIYTGDLARAIADTHRILKPGGRLVFSCEAAGPGEADFVLRPSMRYAHRAGAIEALCRAAGFDTVDLEAMPIRHEDEKPIEGFLATARKAG